MTASSSGPERGPQRERDPSWSASRLGLASIGAYLRGFPLPTGRVRWVHLLGGTIAVLLALEIASGLLLLLYYRPSVQDAHASVLQVTETVRFGWWIRGVHAIGAHAIALLLFGHALSSFLRRSFRQPRELTWWTGILLGLINAAFAFSGTILPWDRSALYAAQVGSSIAQSTPLVGQAIAKAFRGGEVVGPQTLHRAFALHVGLLPALTVLLGLGHVALVHLHGLHGAPARDSRSPRENLRSLLPSAMFGWLVAINAVVITAALAPPGIESQADLTAAPAGAAEPAWYFMAVFELARSGWASGPATPVVLLATMGVLVTAPFWARRTDRPVFAAGAGLVIAVVTLTLLAYGAR